MGTYIRKFMGYGLKNLKVGYCDEYPDYIVSNDSRVNLDFLKHQKNYSDQSYLDHIGKLINEEKDPDEKSSLEMERFFFTDSISKNFSIDHNLNLQQSYNAYNAIKYDNENGLANAILIMPPAMVHSDWSREDNDMDYAETDTMEPSIKEFQKPLYPYDGWMDATTGEPIKTGLLRNVNSIRYLEGIIPEKSGHEEKGKLESALQKLYQTIGMKDSKELESRVVPIVPLSVRMLISWSGIIKQESIKELRPMLYTYWS